MAHTRGVAAAVVRVLELESRKRRPEALAAGTIAMRAYALGIADLSPYQVTKAMQRVRALGHNVETIVTQRPGERPAPARYRVVPTATRVETRV
jgi:hypothetical protein